METCILGYRNCCIFTFKSYYVVWKPINRGSFEISVSLFKSYYVVWKLLDTDIKHNEMKQFKSYYVVWKQSNRGDYGRMLGCLNRTMQYGNICLFRSFKKLAEFKSYYVVWKPVGRKG